MSMTACAGTGAVASGTGERVEDGTIVYAHQQEPDCIFGGWIEQSYISYNVLDSLFALDENGEAVPWLASGWKLSEDRLTYTITVEPGNEFTDGTPVDAEAIAYNFNYWAEGGNSTALAWLGGYYESTEVIDEHTLAVHLSQPYLKFIENLTQGYFGIQSPQALETRTEEENCEAPIGSGAFVVDEWNRGENLVLVRNENYTSAPANADHDGPAYVEKIDWRFVPEGVTRVAALRSGEVDAIYDIPAIEWSGLEDSGYELQKYVTGGRPQQISLTTTQGPFVDENVRKAFIYSLDRQSAVETIGQGVIPYEGNGGVSQSTPGYSQDAADYYSYDPVEAIKLLEASGWSTVNADGYREKDGELLEIDIPYGAGSIINADGASILQALQEQAKATGFKVNLIPVPQGEFFAGAYSTAEERDAYPGYWTAINGGILYINWRQHTEAWPNYANSAFYNSEELENLILAGNSAPDQETQDAYYAQAQEYIAEHALSFGIYDRLSTLGVNPRLQGVKQEHAQGGPTFHDAYFVE
ncbi:ABC transporter substrate-binding protein [Gulosibacter chungangensis]|uniref:ABC transporter substrate-binding protein n=2 Tax=Gulosibacter chungangensis TaxID=979746 RepID=A0A7J5BGE6_9MICO|nr:ABC transporter substrate-binding protein [Gulosibacter chungangensis]